MSYRNDDGKIFKVTLDDTLTRDICILRVQAWNCLEKELPRAC